MRSGKSVFSLLISVLLISCFAAAQAKLETVPALTDASVPNAVRAAAEPSGAKLVRPDGSTLCEIWLRKQLPAAKAANTGVVYPDLSESVLVGVISFPNGAKDFRGQAIKPGFYTMRYELLPEDGNHMGVAPTRDFVLLLPAGTDSDPDAHYDFAQMVKLSSQASGTNHPAAFVLLAPESLTLSAPNAAGAVAPENNPTLSAPKPGADKGGATTSGATAARTYQNTDGYQVFAGALKTNAGKSMPIALVVKGQAEQ